MTLCSAAAMGQLKLRFDDPKDREIWTSPTLRDREPKKPIRVGGTTAMVRSGTEANYVFVRDLQSGNVAIFSTTGKALGETSVTNADFRYAGTVGVVVSENGSPKANAPVQLTDGQSTIDSVTDDSGVARFFGVLPGVVQVKSGVLTASASVSLGESNPTIKLNGSRTSGSADAPFSPLLPALGALALIGGGLAWAMRGRRAATA